MLTCADPCLSAWLANNEVPREVIRWAMCKLEVEEWLVSSVMSTYTGAVRTVNGNSNGLEVKDGMHQGSALSTLLFVIKCHEIFIKRIQSCLTMGVAVCR